jgi:carbon monoxide dehydrogenase subunit G
MEIDIERHERILAPVELVWDEIDTLEKLLAKSPQAFNYDLVPGGQRATAKANLAWGPIKWTLDIEASIEDFRPLQRLVYVIVAPTLELRLEATIDLVVVGDAETRLDYRAKLDLRHRLASRMRGMFNEITEEHTHGLVSRVKVKAEQRRLAQDRLLS